MNNANNDIKREYLPYSQTHDCSHYASARIKLKRIEKFYSMFFAIHCLCAIPLVAIFLGGIVTLSINIQMILIMIGYVVLTVLNVYLKSKKMYIIGIIVSFILLIWPLTALYAIALYCENERDKLKELEGYPYFNERFTQSNERREYVPEANYLRQTNIEREMPEVSLADKMLEDMYVPSDVKKDDANISRIPGSMTKLSDM